MTDFATLPAGPELDRLVATLVMKWRFEEGVDQDGWYYQDFHGESQSGFSHFECRSCGYSGLGEEWAPSSNIAHAMEVAARFPSMELSHLPKGGEFRWKASIGIGAGYADTAELAICRSALEEKAPRLLLRTLRALSGDMVIDITAIGTNHAVETVTFSPRAYGVAVVSYPHACGYRIQMPGAEPINLRASAGGTLHFESRPDYFRVRTGDGLLLMELSPMAPPS